MTHRSTPRFSSLAAAALLLGGAACVSDPDAGDRAWAGPDGWVAGDVFEPPAPDDAPEAPPSVGEPGDPLDFEPAIPPGTHVWSSAAGGPATDLARSVALGAYGELLVTGSFYGTLDLGDESLRALGGYRVLAAAYSNAGELLWARTLPGTGNHHGHGIAGHPDGGYVLFGAFTGTIDLGGGPLDSAGKSDAFLARFDGRGEHVWSTRFGGVDQVRGLSVGVDGHGRIVAAGTFAGTASFDDEILDSRGGEDVFVALLDSAGVVTRVVQIGDTEADELGGLAVHPSGAFVLAGTSTLPGSRDGAAAPTEIEGDRSPMRRAMVAAFHADGNVAWVRALGTGGDGSAAAVAIDATGNVAVAGSFAGALHFGGAHLEAAGGTDAFVALYDVRGQELWARATGGDLDDTAAAVAIDPVRGVIVAGTFRGAVHDASGAVTLASSGGEDVFVRGYGMRGTPRWQASYGGIGDDRVAAITVDYEGNLTLTGGYEGHTSYGGETFVSRGGYDLFVATVTQ
jgi:hypothetical protein